MPDRFDDLELDDDIKGSKKSKSDLSLEEVLRFMIDNNIELIQIDGYVHRYDKTRGISHKVRRFKNGIPIKE
jgi:hypothetical protein